MINLSRYSHINVTPQKGPAQEIKGIGGERYGTIDSMEPPKTISVMDVDVTSELIAVLMAIPAEEIYYRHEIYYALSHEHPMGGKIPYIIMSKARDLSVEEKLDAAT